MAKRISELAELTTVTAGDVVPIVTGMTTTPVTRRIQVGNLLRATDTLQLADSATGLRVLDAAGNELVVLNSLSAYSGGVGVATAGTPRLFMGRNASSGDDSAVLIGRNVAGDSLFSHAIRDESTFNSATTGAYASFDAAVQFQGSTHYNHLNCFQARPNYGGSGTLDGLWGHTFQPTISGPVTNAYGLYVLNPLGTGAINMLAGIYIEALTRGASNYGVYQDGSAPNYFGGKVQSGGDVVAAGVVSGSNLAALAANNTLKVGTGFSTADLYYDTLIGHNAGHSLTDGQRNTFVGVGAGYTATGGDGNVFLGFKAGYYETGDNKLFIDNQDRSSEAIARTEALIVGLFTDSSTTQEIRFNVGKMGFFGQAPASKPTGVAVTAAAIHAALVTLGLIAA